MSDWKYYSPSHNMPCAGDLLRAVPTRRNLRLERIVVDDDEESYEAVRAAETLFGLSVRLRLLNNPDGAMTLTVRDATRQDRLEFEELGLAEPAPDEIQVFAEITLHETAMDAGFVALADDVLCGLEEVFGGGIAVSPLTQEVFEASRIARLMSSEDTPWTHVDVRLAFDEDRMPYVRERLQEALPEKMSALLRFVDDRIELRGRFPATLETDQYQAVWQALLETAPFANAGHIRFRERGTWSNIVDGIGEGQLADVPANWGGGTGGLRGVISRLFRRD